MKVTNLLAYKLKGSFFTMQVTDDNGDTPNAGNTFMVLLLIYIMCDNKKNFQHDYHKLNKVVTKY